MMTLLCCLSRSIDEAKLDLTFSVVEDENTDKPKVFDLKANGKCSLVASSVA
jgi:hypothetical protein